MSAETILRNAAAAENRTRAMALAVQRAAETQPDQEILQVAAETTHIMLEVSRMRAETIRCETIENRRVEFEDQASELMEQMTDGLRSRDSALEKLDQMQAGEVVRFAQHRLDAWETAENEMRDLMNRVGLHNGA